jgi:hypothetical protein
MDVLASLTGYPQARINFNQFRGLPFTNKKTKNYNSKKNLRELSGLGRFFVWQENREPKACGCINVQ